MTVSPLTRDVTYRMQLRSSRTFPGHGPREPVLYFGRQPQVWAPQVVDEVIRERQNVVHAVPKRRKLMRTPLSRW